MVRFKSGWEGAQGSDQMEISEDEMSFRRLMIETDMGGVHVKEGIDLMAQLGMGCAMRTLCLWIFAIMPLTTYSFTIIAHRGASGYVVEHTAPAVAIAHAMGADFIEQDVVLTKDGVPIVLHDIILETTTDVKERFPGRARTDGHFYAIDFTLEEIRQLTKRERFDPETGKAVYPERYPVEETGFAVLTLEESLSLIRGLDRAAGRRTGVYPEIKKPEFHLANGQNPVPPILEVLRDSGYLDMPDRLYIQCFFPDTLREVRKVLGREVPLVQLIGRNEWNESSVDYGAMVTPEGIREIAAYADGIGLPLDLIVDASGAALQWKALKEKIQQQGLLLHPYTFRLESLPEPFGAKDLMLFLSGPGGVDGVFTDFPDRR